MRPTTLVGRAREVELLAARVGDGGLVVLRGEAGAGKTRLVEDCLAALPDGAGLVHRCPPVRHGGRAWLAGLLDGSRRVAVIEDAQWADVRTQDAIVSAACRVPSSTTLVVTWRDEDLSEGSPLRRLLEHPPAPLAHLRLSPLGREDTAAVIAELRGRPGEPNAADPETGLRAAPWFDDEVGQLTDGVPGLVVDLLDHLAATEGRLTALVDGRGWPPDDAVRAALAPTSVRERVRLTMSEIGAESRAIVGLCLAAAEPTSIDTLLEALDRLGVSAAEPDEALQRCVRRGLLAEDPAGRVMVRHELMRLAIAAETPAHRRIRLHRVVGEALAAAGPADTRSRLRHARGSRDLPGWVACAAAVAEEAIAHGDTASAVRSLAEVFDEPIGGLANASRIPVLLASAVQNRTTGDEVLLSQALPRIKAAAQDPGLDESVRGTLRSKLRSILVESDGQAEQRAGLVSAVSHLSAHPFERAAAMSKIGWPTADDCPAAVCRRWLDRAAAVPRDGMELFEQIFVDVNCATSLLYLSDEAGWRLMANVAERALQPSWSSTAGLSARFGMMVCQLNAGACAIVWGRLSTARASLERARDLARADNNLRITSLVTTSLCRLDYLLGRRTGLADRLHAVSSDPNADFEAVNEARMVAALLEGESTSRVREWREHLSRVLDGVGRVGTLGLLMPPTAALAAAELAEGRVDSALALTEPTIAIIRAKQSWVWASELAPVHAACLLAAGRKQEAAALVAEQEDAVRALDAPAATAGWRAAVAEAAGAEDPLAAADLFGEAADAWAVVPRPHDVALATERRGALLLEAGDRDGGMGALTRAHVAAADLGASRDAARIARRLRAAGAEVRWSGSRGRRGYGGALSPKELDVVRLVAQGMTNRQIAEELFRAPATVSGQVRAAVRKMQAPTRTALAVAALEAGVIEQQEPVDPFFAPSGA